MCAQDLTVKVPEGQFVTSQPIREHCVRKIRSSFWWTNLKGETHYLLQAPNTRQSSVPSLSLRIGIQNQMLDPGTQINTHISIQTQSQTFFPDKSCLFCPIDLELRTLFAIFLLRADNFYKLKKVLQDFEEYI